MELKLHKHQMKVKKKYGFNYLAYTHTDIQANLPVDNLIVEKLLQQKS